MSYSTGLKMNLTINKFSYLVIIFLVVCLLDITFNTSKINLRSPLFVLFSLIILDEIFIETSRWYNLKSRFSIYKKICFLYFLAHPVLIIFLSAGGFWGLLSSISPVKIFLSSMNITFQVFAGIFFLQRINVKNFETVNKFICILSLIFLTEFVLSRIFSIDSRFGPSGEYVGFMNSEWFVSLCALLAFHFSMSNLIVKRQKRYIFYVFCFLFLGYVAQLRIFQLAVLIYLLFSLLALLRIGVFIQIAAVTISILVFSIYNLSALDGPFAWSLFDRFYLFAKQIDLISSHFLLGVGGNVSEKYYGETSPHLLYVFADFVGLTNLQAFTDVLTMNEHHAETGYYAKRSSHCTPLDIIGDYGVLGIILVGISILWPLKVLSKTQKIRKRSLLDLQTQQSAIAILSLFGFNLFESQMNYLWIGLLLFSYMIHLDRQRYAIHSNVS